MNSLKNESTESLYRVSHEIKNSLSVINGYISLMDGSMEKYDKYFPLVKKYVKHSIKLLDDFSNLGKLDYNFDVMDINYLLDDVVLNYKYVLESEGINLIYKQNKNEVFISGDYKRLSEVLINILKNAKESLVGRENPTIIVSTNYDDNNIIVKISDNGCGIEDDNEIGNAFYTTKQNGIGLGVLLSKEIIKAHKGQLLYDSIFQKGTDVYIYLKMLR